MALRNHPLMSYRSIPNWPPVWVRRAGQELKRVSGEVGILTQLEQPQIPTMDRLFLRIEYESNSYMGCLLFDDACFCRYIEGVLTSLCGQAISEIGSIDLSYTL